MNVLFFNVEEYAFYNFAKPQLKNDLDRQAMDEFWEPKVQQLMIDGNVDVTTITLEETPGETRKAGQNIENEGF